MKKTIHCVKPVFDNGHFFNRLTFGPCCHHRCGYW